MSGIAVGAGDELDSMSHLRPERGGAAHANVAIIGMRAEGDDPQFLALLSKQRRGSGRHSRLYKAASVHAANYNTDFRVTVEPGGPRLKAVVVVGLALVLFGTLTAFQRYNNTYEYEMQNPALDPPDAGEKTEYAFARLRYRSIGRGFGGRRFRGGGNSWATDSNKAERQFVQGVRRLTRVHVRSVEQIIDVDTDDMYDWPWLYAVEVGRWELNDPQAKRLRDYLDRGGFLMIDDFHGTQEWDTFLASMQRVFPDRPIIDIEDGDPIFNVIYSLKERVQVPGRQYLYSGVTYERDGIEARWRGIYDEKGRIQVAICFNQDYGDAWEWADLPEYPEKFASLAYRIGINYLVYSMTH